MPQLAQQRKRRIVGGANNWQKKPKVQLYALGAILLSLFSVYLIGFLHLNRKMGLEQKDNVRANAEVGVGGVGTKQGMNMRLTLAASSIVTSSSSILTCQTNKPIRTRTARHGEKTARYKVNDNGLHLKLENDIARAGSFEKIYENFVWGHAEIIDGKKTGGSGPGSLMSSTIEVRKTLDVVIRHVKAELGKERIRMLDLPCGDLVWMKEYLKDRTDIEYTGMDIVGPLIEQHSNMFSDKYPWSFIQHDIVKEPLPAKFDLIFSRQMTQHLGTEDTMRVLQHFSDGASFLLITNYPATSHNRPLDTTTTYRFRPQNLNISPFNLADPICEDEERGCVNDLFKLPLQQWSSD